MDHIWHFSNHGKPTFCNVCRESLTLHGLSCGVCKLRTHKTCLPNVLAKCKWATADHIDTDLFDDNGAKQMPHQWVEGNLGVAARCVVCDKTCGSVLRLQDWRCLWCRATVHTTCRSSYVPRCSLGATRHATVPPTALTGTGSGAGAGTGSGDCVVNGPLPGSPLIVFVNSKSGDAHGQRFLRRFKQILNPGQVFDLCEGGPRKGLEVFRALAPLRLLICGGDGSVGWVLTEIDRLKLKAESVSVSVLPLGTGNDLARVCGWGSAIEDDVNLVQLLEKYDIGSPRLLDRWSVMSVTSSESGLNETQLVEAPTIAEHRRRLGEHLQHFRVGIEDILDGQTGIGSLLADLEQRRTSFLALHKLVSEVVSSSEDRPELLAVSEEANALMLAIVAKAATCRGDNHEAEDSRKNDGEQRMDDGNNEGDDDSLDGVLMTLSSKLETLQELLMRSHDDKDLTKVSKEIENDPVILITAPSLDEDEDIAISSGEVFRQMVGGIDSLVNEKANSESVLAQSRPFSPSLTTRFPFPPFRADSNKSDSDEASRTEDESKDESSSSSSPSSQSKSVVSQVPLTLEVKVDVEPTPSSLESTGVKDELLLASLSPLPSPGSRHGSIFSAANEIGVPDAFCDASKVDYNPNEDHNDDKEDKNEEKHDETTKNDGEKEDHDDEKKDNYAEREEKQILIAEQPISSINIIGTVESISESVISKLPRIPLPNHSCDEDADEFETKLVKESDANLLLHPPLVSLGEGTNPAPYRKRSSKGSSLLSSVPEHHTMVDDETMDLFNDSQEDMLRRGSEAGRSRRLSVGAMVSLSTLRSESGSRMSNKTIPIINPLVKNPNWPNLERTASRGLISMVVLASADALCAPVTPIMDWTPPPEKMEEISVMNNYFGIGIDAKISLDFHNKREEATGKQRSRARNYMWYGVLGSRELVQKTYKNLEKRVILECDGEAIPLPSLQGIVVLNIQSFMGGTNFWGMQSKEDNIFLPASFDDGILEVVAVFGSMHMGASRIMNLQRHRIAQCRSVVIRILGEEGVPVQVDGEAWLHPPGIIRIMHKNRVQLICRDRTMEQQIRHGSSSRAWYREHAHPVLLPLDEEELHLLRSLTASSRQLLHHLLLLHHALDGQEGRDLASMANTLQESMLTIPTDAVLSLPAAESRRRAALFVNHLRSCIASCKKTLVENSMEAQSEVAARLSQSIYTVESQLGKCHEEGDLLFFTIRSPEPPPDGGRRSSWFRSLPLFNRGSPTNLGPSSTPPSSAASTSSSTFFNRRKSTVNTDSSCLTEVVLQWNPQEVSQWLESIGLPMYCHAFLEHEISGRELMALDRKDFKDVGVTKVGHIKRLQHAVKDIQQGKLPPRLLQSSFATPTTAMPTLGGMFAATLDSTAALHTAHHN